VAGLSARPRGAGDAAAVEGVGGHRRVRRAERVTYAPVAILPVAL
jgi:hypothetical protein